MKKRTKYGLTIVGIIAILTFMTMAITNMNKKSILEKDSHKTGKLVATKPEIEKALEEMKRNKKTLISSLFYQSILNLCFISKMIP